MPHEPPLPGDLVRATARVARRLAETARLQEEPAIAERFEQLAAQGEARARLLDDVACIHAAPDELRGRQLIGVHEAPAVRQADSRITSSSSA